MQPSPIAVAGAGGLDLRGDAWGDPGAYAIAMDLRGHGDSGWPADGDYGLLAFAGDLRALVDHLGRAPIVVGASLGGLTALVAEGAVGPTMRGLVLVDVAPRLEPEGVMRIIAFMQTGLDDGFASLDDAADAIAKYLPHRPRPRATGGLAKNLRQGADGRWRWHWDPRFVRRDRGDPTFDHAGLCAAARALAIPTMIVRGRMSDVLSDEGVRELRALVPHAEYVDVAGAAHMVAGDDNDAFSAAVIDFVRRAPDSGLRAPGR